jgi:hypothetical protein
LGCIIFDYRINHSDTVKNNLLKKIKKAGEGAETPPPAVMLDPQI